NPPVTGWPAAWGRAMLSGPHPSQLGGEPGMVLEDRITMVSEDCTTSFAQFGTVDASADPGGLIRFLDVANAVSGLRVAKDALMEQLALGRARAALDVGCGAGGDMAEMVRLMLDGTHVLGVDASET